MSADKAGPATVTVDTKASTDLKATAVFDAAASNVVFSLTNESLTAVLGEAFVRGAALTNLAVTSTATNQAGSFDADSAAGATPEEKTYAYGDNTCFLPPAAKLALTSPASGVVRRQDDRHGQPGRRGRRGDR